MNMYLVPITLMLFVSQISTQEFTEEQRKKIIENRQECIKSTKVNPELIERADLGDFTDDQSLKCFTKCFYQKAGFVNEKGEVQRDVIKAKLPSGADIKKALEIVDKCVAKGKDPCETVYMIHKCYFEETHPQVDSGEASQESAEKKEA